MLTWWPDNLVGALCLGYHLLQLFCSYLEIPTEIPKDPMQVLVLSVLKYLLDDNAYRSLPGPFHVGYCVVA